MRPKASWSRSGGTFTGRSGGFSKGVREAPEGRYRKARGVSPEWVSRYKPIPPFDIILGRPPRPGAGRAAEGTQGWGFSAMPGLGADAASCTMPPRMGLKIPSHTPFQAVTIRKHIIYCCNVDLFDRQGAFREGCRATAKASRGPRQPPSVTKPENSTARRYKRGAQSEPTGLSDRRARGNSSAASCDARTDEEFPGQKPFESPRRVRDLRGRLRSVKPGKVQLVSLVCCSIHHAVRSLLTPQRRMS
jgi:hypothetical protein